MNNYFLFIPLSLSVACCLLFCAPGAWLEQRWPRAPWPLSCAWSRLSALTSACPDTIIITTPTLLLTLETSDGTSWCVTLSSWPVSEGHVDGRHGDWPFLLFSSSSGYSGSGFHQPASGPNDITNNDQVNNYYVSWWQRRSLRESGCRMTSLMSSSIGTESSSATHLFLGSLLSQ